MDMSENNMKSKHISSANKIVSFILQKNESSDFEWNIIMASIYDLLKYRINFGDFFVHQTNDAND